MMDEVILGQAKTVRPHQFRHLQNASQACRLATLQSIIDPAALSFSIQPPEWFPPVHGFSGDTDGLRLRYGSGVPQRQERS